ncbi:MAG: hypothetical protein ACSLE1_13155 [Sphingobium sp.]
MRADVSKLALLILPASACMSQPASAEAITSRTPQEHIVAFQKDCQAGNVAAATCSCMVQKLQETAQGDASLDVMGLMAYRTGKARDVEMVPLLDRHGLRASELQAILSGEDPLVVTIAEQCA